MGYVSWALAALSLAAALVSTPAAANTIWENGYDPSVTYLGADGALDPGGYLAQRFTLSEPMDLQSVQIFTHLDGTGVHPTRFNWLLYSATAEDEIGGLLASNVAAGGGEELGQSGCAFEFGLCRDAFSVINLNYGEIAAGSYYFAFQFFAPPMSATFGVSSASDKTGMARSLDGGLTWAYEPTQGFAMQVNDNISDGGIHTRPVPEPGTWALMIVGFGLAGAALRRRRLAFS